MLSNGIAIHEVAITQNIVSTAAGSLDFGLIESISPVLGIHHRIIEVSEEEGTFTLDNRSKWQTANIDMIKSWKEDDLIITQNQAIFSVHRFALVNPRLQKAVPISLLREPLPMDGKTFFIRKIDLPNDLITLDNSVDWTVYPSDHGTLRKFNENDRIMIGLNSSETVDTLNSEKYKFYILINTTSNLYVRATPTTR